MKNFILFFYRVPYGQPMKIFNDDQKQYLIIVNQLQISENHINRIIKKYHNESLQKYFEIFKILQFL